MKSNEYSTNVYKSIVKFRYKDVLDNLNKIIFKKVPGETIILSDPERERQIS